MTQTLWVAEVPASAAEPPKTRHYKGGKLLPTPYSLAIVRYERDAGYYLLYLDKDGIEQTDTYHDTLEAAFEQAHFEFGIEKSDWSAVEKS